MRSRPIAFFTLMVLLASALVRTIAADDQMAALWQDPVDLERRDLLYGPGGRGLVPLETASYELIDVDTKGFSSGYDVRDAQGRKWSVKLGPEAQPEVVVSRLLWAVGYHQPATYYLPRWTLSANGKRTTQPPARFRLEAANRKNVGEWSWRDNPFVGSRPFQGLVVMMVMVNNWDLKTSQNVIYRVDHDRKPHDVYVVKDLGASLGKTGWLLPGTRDDLQGFEEEGFVSGVEGNRVKFDYKGGWREPQVIASVAPADVRWICALLARLSPQQWGDAFRAGGYSASEADRYIKRLRQKVAEGQELG
ncbi:MAG TPA: hypothetical protein VM818_07040 [Vicinamibacterales bacterium]|jgi:hypothetical protein|nr:hypothetical protein [Vicinamibacterales bacterium]